jgi:NADPH:quinone reductase-like Zn-dependent oxidoreductase
MADAASIPLSYSMAVLALIHTARLGKNETVLIHTAAGAVGQACVVIARHLGARIFATAGTPAKRAFLHETFGIPENHIFPSRTPGFRDAILAATSGKGVDVIVNSLGGDLLAETWGLAAPFGLFIEISKKDAFHNNYLPMRPFDSNVTFSGVNLRDLFEYRPETLREIFSKVVSLVQSRVAVPIKTVTVLPISQFPAALRKLKSGEHMGKIAVTLGQDDNVLAESSLQPTEVALKPNATYLITGGTRGIGLNLGSWMIEHGARNIVLLGRSGSTGTQVQSLLRQFEGTDVTVRALACDVGSRSQLEDVMKSITDLPPVRGVVHSALLLSVSAYLMVQCHVQQFIMLTCHARTNSSRMPHSKTGRPSVSLVSTLPGTCTSCSPRTWTSSLASVPSWGIRETPGKQSTPAPPSFTTSSPSTADRSACTPLPSPCQ